jgi:hypothetical protein
VMMVICTSDMFPPSTPLIPLSIRWTSHENAGIPPDRYEFPYDIVRYAGSKVGLWVETIPSGLGLTDL